MRYFVGIDAGGTRTKAALFDERGRQMAACGAETPLHAGKDGVQERDMEALWQAAAQVVQETIQSAGINPAEIAGVGCTGHGKGLYLWGKDGRPAAPAAASTDRRAEALVAEWNRNGTAQRAAGLSRQPVSAGQPAALLAWYRREHPEIYRNIRWIFEAKDYLRFRLTGEARAEYTDYSGTSLMNLETRTFDPALLALFGVPEVMDALPPLCRSDELCGRVSAQAAAETGLPEGTPVCGGMFDIDACAIASGVTDGEDLCVIAGTWAINEYISRHSASDIRTTRNSIYCIPDWYLIEESSPASSGNLEWVRAQLLSGADRSFDAINAMVEATDPAESRVMFAPYLYGSNVEGCGSGFFFGLNNAHTQADLLRAVYEGVVYTHRIHIDRLLAGRPKPRAVRLSGGAANSGVWAQMFADCLDCPVELVPDGELGALGCAMAAAVSAGVYADYEHAVEAMAPKRTVRVPNPARTAVYEEKFQRHKALLERVSGLT